MHLTIFCFILEKGSEDGTHNSVSKYHQEKNLSVHLFAPPQRGYEKQLISLCFERKV